MKKIRKAFVISTMFVTVLAMSIVVAPGAGATASAGDLIKMSGLSSVYYLAADGKRYVFPNESTYSSWYSNFSGVVTIPQSELESYPLGKNITVRPGTKLVKITTDPKVYAVETNGSLVHLASETAATTLFGSTWASRVIDVPDAFFTNYTVSGNQLTGTAYPTGSLIKTADSSTVYYISSDGKARKVASEAALTANRFQNANIITTTLAIPTAGTDITGAESTLIDTSSGAGGAAGAGTGLTVALSANTAAAATTLSEGGADGAQALIPVTSVNLTAASDGAVKVNTLKFKRGGVPSADTDFSEFYLYDGTTLLAKYSSISSGVLSFNNASGLVTVPAGSTKTVTLKVNLDKDTAASRAYNFSIQAASDITTDGAAVSGTFPITGNTMTTAAVTDLGKVTFAHSSNSSAPDPGTTGHTLWRFTAAAADQNVQIEKLTLTLIGTVDATDLTNFKLEVGGVQIGSTVAAMSSDKTVTFTFDTPYAIAKGNTKTIDFKGDIAGGTSRTYQVYLNNKEDAVVKDTEYGVYVTPNQADTWTDINAAAATTINPGSLTVSKNVGSPTTSIASGATNVEIGKFDFKATGEAIKIDSVNLYTTGASLYQVKLYVDGSQIGTAANVATTTVSEVSLGNSFIVSAGTTKTLVVKADVKHSNGTNHTSGASVTMTLGNVTSASHTKQTSGGTGTTGAVSANVRTISTGTLTASENLSFGDRSSAAPTGVANATGKKLASFTITAGAGEGVTITQIELTDPSATTLLTSNFQNLMIKHGTTQLGNTIANMNSSDGSYNFSPSPAIVLAANEQYVVDVYGDIKSSASLTGMNHRGIEFGSVTATGNVTNNSASYDPTDFELQTMYVAAVGNLNMSDDGDTPVAQQIIMGATDQEVARFRFEASSSEDINVTEIVISDNVSSAATGTLKNIKLYDTAGTLLGGPINLDTTNASTTHAHAVVPVNFTVTAGGAKTIVVKADVGSAGDGATSASTHTMSLLITNGISGKETVTAKGAGSGTVLTTSADTLDWYSTTDTATDVSQVGNQMTVYRTKVTASFASDTPSGAATGSSAQTIAKINITNSSNVGNHTATIKYVNLALSTSISNTANRALTVYKDNTSTTALATTSWLAAGNQNFGDTAITDAGMTDVEIAAGATKTFIFTLDTTNGSVTGDFALSVNMAAGDIGWTDSTSGGATITTVNSLPLETKTFTY